MNACAHTYYDAKYKYNIAYAIEAAGLNGFGKRVCMHALTHIVSRKYKYNITYAIEAAGFNCCGWRAYMHARIHIAMQINTTQHNICY